METPNPNRTSLQSSILEAVLHLWGHARGQHWLSITGRSMFPVLREGDSILVAHGCTDVHRGDVIVFRHQGGLTAHRVICISGSDDYPTFITKGDNAARCDPPVDTNDIVGRVLAVKQGARCLPLDTPIWRMMGWLIAVNACAWRVLDRWSWGREQKCRDP